MDLNQLRQELNLDIEYIKTKEVFVEYQKKRVFEEDVYRIIEKYSKYTENMITSLEEIYVKSENDLENRYIAFFIVATIIRRNNDIDKLKELLREYKDTFRQYISFEFLENLMKKYYYEEYKDDLIFEASDLYERNKMNDGYSHNYAETVCLVFENSPEKREEYEDRGKKILENSIRLVRNNIDNRDYPKFHATLGRIYGLLGDFEKSYKEINSAIRSENSSRIDYALVILNYQNNISTVKNIEFEHRAKIELDKTVESYENKIKEIFEENTMKTLELLSIFTAVVSFTIGGLNLFDANDYISSAKLLVLLFTCIVFVHSWVVFLIKGSRKETVIAIVVSMLIIMFLMFG